MDRAVALVAGPNAPAAARERAAEFCSDLLAAEETAMLRLLVSEIVSEAVELADGGRRVFQLHLTVVGDHIHVEIARTGAKADDAPDEPVRRAILDRSTLSWGADERDGGRLWFDFAVGADHPGATVEKSTVPGLASR